MALILVVLQAFDGLRCEVASLDITGKMFRLYPILTMIVVQICCQNIGSGFVCVALLLDAPLGRAVDLSASVPPVCPGLGCLGLEAGAQTEAVCPGILYGGEGEDCVA